MNWYLTNSSLPMKPYLLICPESKLWVGVFKRWVHAWLHLHRRFTEAQRAHWFIMSLEDWNARHSTADKAGWLRYETPIHLKWHQTCEHPKYRTLNERHRGFTE